MNVSLEQFLSTGFLGTLQLGMSAQQARDLMGEPEDTGGTSRKYPHPSVYLYGTVEIYFQQQSPFTMTGIFWDAETKGAFRLPTNCHVEDWELTPLLHLSDVEKWLHENQLEFVRLPALAPELPSRLVFPSGVHISFNQDEQLASLFVGLL